MEIMEMKKYPVTYKGKEYEVRWELYLGTILTIYEVKEIKIFKKLKLKKYIKKYSTYLHEVQKLVTVSDDDPNYHIQEVKTLFDMWKLELQIEEYENKTERIQKKALEEWDGVING